MSLFDEIMFGLSKILCLSAIIAGFMAKDNQFVIAMAILLIAIILDNKLK
jgi:hypothetical protein